MLLFQWPRVKGTDFLFDIDAIDHNNGKLMGMRPNRFDGNDIIFEVCYNGFNYDDPIRARGNVWEVSGNVSTAPPANKFNVDNWCVKNTPITVDYQNFSKCVPTETCEDCGFNAVVNMNPHKLIATESLMTAYVKCEERVKMLEVKQIGTEYELAKEEFVVLDEQLTRDKYKEVSRIHLEKKGNNWVGCHEEDLLANRCGGNVHERILPEKCVHLIRVARVVAEHGSGIVTGQGSFKKGENETQKTFENAEFDREVEQISIYPNPNSGKFIVETTDVGVIHVYDYLGKNIYTKQVLSTITIVEFEQELQGVYLLEFVDSYGVSTKQRFVVD